MAILNSILTKQGYIIPKASLTEDQIEILWIKCLRWCGADKPKQKYNGSFFDQNCLEYFFTLFKHPAFPPKVGRDLKFHSKNWVNQWWRLFRLRMSRIVLISTANSATQATKLQIIKGNRVTGF